MKTVYALADPRCPEIVRYVGCTVNPDDRYRKHVWEATGDSPNLIHSDAKDAWIRSLLAIGRKPVLRILENVEEESQAMRREEFWIAAYRSPRLLNFDRPPAPPAERKELATEASRQFYSRRTM